MSATKRLVEAARRLLASDGGDGVYDAGENYHARREVKAALAEAERALLGTPWQCSGCREVFFGRHRETCPGCGRVGYWTGSIEPRALSAAQDRALAALDAERPAACPDCGLPPGHGDGQCSAHDSRVRGNAALMLWVVACGQRAERRTAERPAVEWRCVGDGLHVARAGEWELRAVEGAAGAVWHATRSIVQRHDYTATLDEAKAAAERAAGVGR